MCGLALSLATQALAAEKVNVLIIDGQHNHNWRQTTPLIKEILTATGRFNVDVATTPAATDPKEAWAKFRPDFAKCKVVLMNYHGQDWPVEVNQAFEKFVDNGGGVVAYHATLFAFPKWDNWNKMIGMGWRPNTFGDSLCIDDTGKVIRIPKGQGPGGSHGPAHPFEITLRDKEHPITKGMPEKWMHIKDELYHGQRGPAQDMHILASAFDAKETGGTGMNELMAWTVSYGKGRIFVCLLGHNVDETKAPDTAAFLSRGAEWAATGQVTIPIQDWPGK
jgi:type 1 glutamine amidotransferase